MSKYVFMLFYFLGALFCAHMSVAFAILNETWISVTCFAAAGLFLVLFYKDGIMAMDE